MRTALLLLLAASTAQAADVTLTWQGRLTDTLGAPVNGEHDITLALFDGSTTMTAAYSETFADVDLADGYVALQLGAGGGLDSSVIPSDAYIGVVIDGVADLGRTPLGVTPVAAVALQSAGADGSASATAARSCLHILESGSSTGSGLYFIDPDGSGGQAAYQAYCDQQTAGGGWTLVWRKESTSFVPVNASTAFDPSCAAATVGDCDSTIAPTLMWREAMFRFEDTDAYVTVIEQMEDWQRGYLNGYPWQDSNHEIIHGIKTWVNGTLAIGGPVDLFMSETSGISESHNGSDRYLDLWDGPDGTNTYVSSVSAASRGTKCIAGYCRNETVLFFVR